jgi:thiol-disulfide isomerase/thioredoxin
MNKLLLKVLLATILATPAVSFCADSNQADVKPKADTQEQAIWDKINNLQKELNAFQQQTMPQRPAMDANEADIQNYLKAVEVFNKGILKQLPPLINAADEYYNKYPKGFYAKENFQLLLILIRSVCYLNDGVLRPNEEAIYNTLCKDKNLNAEQANELFWVNLISLQSRIEDSNENKKPDKKAIEAILDKIEAQINNFGSRFESEDKLLASQITASEQIKDLYPQRSVQILELAKKYSTGDNRTKLEGIIRQRNIIGKNLEIKFKAVDGNEVDLSKMKGKVVLVDFWATWCPPCRKELPNVLDVYKKYHSKGFEIIGISFEKDKDPESLKSFTKGMDMPWPQYFDGKYWDNDLGIYYGIQGIPAMWLVNKDGKVVDIEAEGPELGNKVKKLLGIQE